MILWKQILAPQSTKSANIFDETQTLNTVVKNGCTYTVDSRTGNEETTGHCLAAFPELIAGREIRDSPVKIIRGSQGDITSFD